MSGFLGALLGGSNQVGSGQSTAIANVLQQVLSQNGGGIATLGRVDGIPGMHF